MDACPPIVDPCGEIIETPILIEGQCELPVQNLTGKAEPESAIENDSATLSKEDSTETTSNEIETDEADRASEAVSQKAPFLKRFKNWLRVS